MLRGEKAIGQNSKSKLILELDDAFLHCPEEVFILVQQAIDTQRVVLVDGPPVTVVAFLGLPAIRELGLKFHFD